MNAWSELGLDEADGRLRPDWRYMAFNRRRQSMRSVAYQTHMRNSRMPARAVRIVCRRLWPSDRASLKAYFLRLDPETRRNRFMSALDDRGALAYAEQAVLSQGMMFGVFADGVLRGLGELRPAGRRSCICPLGSRAEAAFAVEGAYRRAGLGSILFRRIVEAARSRGVSELHVRCLNGNGPMHRLALKLGADLHPVGSETDGAILLEAPTPLSLWSEGVAEALDLSLALAAAAETMSMARSPIPAAWGL